jgi:hypothetical protein
MHITSCARTPKASWPATMPLRRPLITDAKDRPRVVCACGSKEISA